MNQLEKKLFCHEIQIWVACLLYGKSNKGIPYMNPFRFEIHALTNQEFIKAYPVNTYEFHVSMIFQIIQNEKSLGDKVSSIILYCTIYSLFYKSSTSILFKLSLETWRQ